MGVFVINGTNAPINVSLSAGFNYDWKNRLNPNEYVELTNGVLVSLNARYWAGEPTEYDTSNMDIGLFVAGTVVGIIGFALCFVPGGAAIVIAASATVGFTGLAIGGVSVLAKEVINTPAHVTSITVSANKKFLITGNLDVSVEHGTAVINGGESIAIKELIGNEFETWLAFHKPLHTPKDPQNVPAIGNDYATRKDLENAGISVGPVWIYPALAGVPHIDPPSWEFNKGGAVQLSDRTGQAQWQIEYVKKYGRDDVAGAPEADAFRLRNLTDFRYLGLASMRPEGNRNTKAVHGDKPDDAALFFLARSANCYAFVPCSRQRTYLVHEDGKLSKGTKVLLDSMEESTGRARWALDPRGRPNGLDGIRLKKITSGERVRFYPALLADSISESGFSPPPCCWEIGNDSPGQAVQLGERDASSVDWIIRPGPDNFFSTLYSPDLQAYAALHNGLLSSGPVGSVFSFGDQMGYLTISPVVTEHHGSVLAAEDITKGKKIKQVLWDKHPPALARWVMVPAKVADAGKKIWGIDNANNIYRWNGDTFDRVQDKFKSIAVGSRGVWGISVNGDAAYRLNGQQFERVEFQGLGGEKLRSLTVVDEEAWGIGDQENVYRWNVETKKFDFEGDKFVSMAVGRQVSGEPAIWGINNQKYVYLWNGAKFEELTALRPLKLQTIATGGTNAWAIGGNRKIYRWNGKSKGEARFDEVQSPPCAGLAASDQEVWGLTEARNNIFRWDGTQFIPVAGNLSSIVVSGTDIWGINNNSDLYKWNGKLGGRGGWDFASYILNPNTHEREPIKLVSIAVSA